MKCKGLDPKTLTLNRVLECCGAKRIPTRTVKLVYSETFRGISGPFMDPHAKSVFYLGHYSLQFRFRLYFRFGSSSSWQEYGMALGSTAQNSTHMRALLFREYSRPKASETLRRVPLEGDLVSRLRAPSSGFSGLVLGISELL